MCILLSADGAFLAISAQVNRLFYNQHFREPPRQFTRNKKFYRMIMNDFGFYQLSMWDFKLLPFKQLFPNEKSALVYSI